MAKGTCEREMVPPQSQKEQKNDLRFYYKDLGTDIGEIFESFNIALSRIQMYGANED